MQRRNESDISNRVPKEPKSTGYLMGISTIAAGVAGLLILLIAPYRVFYFGDGDSGWGCFSTEMGEIHFFPSYTLISYTMAIGIIAVGAILVITTLLVDLEVIDKVKALFINYITGTLLIIPSLGLIFVGIYTNATTWTFLSMNRILFFFSPFLLLMIGLFSLQFSFSVSQNTIKCIRYNNYKKDNIGRKKTRPRPIKKTATYRGDYR